MRALVLPSPPSRSNGGEHRELPRLRARAVGIGHAQHAVGAELIHPHGTVSSRRAIGRLDTRGPRGGLVLGPSEHRPPRPAHATSA